MDKFVVEQLTYIKELADDLQACFIDDDAYSRTPSPTEWRRAGRTVRQISLACHELFGYASACRILYIDDARNSLRVVSSTQTETKTPDAGTSDEDEHNVAFFTFTEQEIQKMPKKFRRYFRINGRWVTMRRRKRGRTSCSYEIRYRRDGYNISAGGKTEELATERFIRKLHELETGVQQSKAPTTFHAFAMFYFENYRKRKVKPLTYKNDLMRYNNHIKNLFPSVPLSSINDVMIQNVIDKYQDAGQVKTAKELLSLFSCIFRYAIDHGILHRNPARLVITEEHEGEHGKALTKAEERLLLSSVEGTTYHVPFAVALYTGLRPCEYRTARIEGDFIVAQAMKQHSKKVIYKRIPISPMLAPHLDGVSELYFPHKSNIVARFKAILPDHKLYDLRTTFDTRCEEFHVEDLARKLWMGHSIDKLRRTYADLPDEWFLKEISKLFYDLPPILPPKETGDSSKK